MADKADDSLYPIAVLIDELKNEDIQVSHKTLIASAEVINALIQFSASLELHQETLDDCLGIGRGENSNGIGAIPHGNYLR